MQETLQDIGFVCIFVYLLFLFVYLFNYLFIYCVCLFTVHKDYLQDVVVAADLLQMKDLKEGSAHVLMTYLDSSNCIGELYKKFAEFRRIPLNFAQI